MKIFNWFKKSYPTIGKEISWKDGLIRVYKVVDFDRAGTIVTDKRKVIAKSMTQPYGYLIVESHNQKEYLRLPIIHQDDFLLASSVYDDKQYVSGLTKEQELLVTYFPKNSNAEGFSLSPHHVLHYAITPVGTKDNYYEKMLFSSHLNIEAIFGQFVWEGELGVKVNLNPDLN